MFGTGLDRKAGVEAGGEWPQCFTHGVARLVVASWFSSLILLPNSRHASHSPAPAYIRWDQPKEPDAGPHVRFCERRGGVIRRAYSTRARRRAGARGALAFGEEDVRERLGAWILQQPQEVAPLERHTRLEALLEGCAHGLDAGGNARVVTG